MSKIVFNYQVPIELIEGPTSGETGNSEFLIQGIAINSTVTDNKHKFVSEELESAAHTLSLVPLLKDHDNSVDSIVGRVIHSEYNSIDKNILFKAKINDTEAGKHIKQLIKSGDLNTVSIGANVESMEEDGKFFIPRGIQFKELSLVAVPADIDAKFTFKGNFINALTEALKLEEMMHCPECEKEFKDKKELSKHMKDKHPDKMDEEKSQSQLNSNLVRDDNNINERRKDMEEEKRTELETLKSEFNLKLETQSELLSQVLSELKVMKENNEKKEEVKEEVKVIEPKVEVKLESQPVVKEQEESKPEEEEDEEEESETVDEKGGYKIVREHRTFSIVRNKYR